MYGEISLLTCSSFLKNRIVKKGFNRLIDLLTSDSENLSKELKVSVNQIRDLQKECQSLISGPDPVFDAIITVPCNDSEVNSKLLGGFKSQCVYEFVGLPGSGRSTFAMNLAVSWIDTVKNSRVYYLDTEGSVDINHFQKISNHNQKIDRIFYSRVVSDAQILKFISQLGELVKKNSLIIIDSLTFLFKEAWSKDKNKPKNLVKIGIKLLEQSHLLNLGIVFVNNFNSQHQVVFGESWGSVISKRLIFSKVNSNFIIDL